MQTLNIIGAGRVGQTLARLWQQHGVLALQHVLTRSAASAQAACAFMGAGTPVTQLAQMRSADKLKARFVLIIGDDEIKKGDKVISNYGKMVVDEIFWSEFWCNWMYGSEEKITIQGKTINDLIVVETSIKGIDNEKF